MGDPVQLPATVLSGRADKHGYSTSLFKRLQTSGFPVQVFRHSFSAQGSTSVIALVSPKGGYACKVMWHSQACTSCSQAGLYNTALASLRDSLCRCWTPSTGCTHASHNSQQPPSMLAICAMERAWKPAPPAHGMSILCVHSCILLCHFVLSRTCCMLWPVTSPCLAWMLQAEFESRHLVSLAVLWQPEL